MGLPPARTVLEMFIDPGHSDRDLEYIRQVSDPMENTQIQLAVACGSGALVFFALWLLQLKTRDAGIVDVAWSYSVGLFALWFAGSSQAGADEFLIRTWVIAGLCTAWSFRLGTYILFNRVIGKEEDGRYQQLREDWGRYRQHFFFVFFQVQGLLGLYFASASLVGMNAADGWRVWDWLGVAIIAASIIGESVADWQLAKFRADPESKGKTCRRGLWRYSRHPNYFFEWLHWWAYVAFAIGSPWMWFTLSQPALMLFFLFRVTGIPATERQAVKSRGDDYREYQRTTSVFVPWFPKAERKSDQSAQRWHSVNA